jgi:hypothetical protein
MASDRRTIANRLNAQKSTGPKTEDGKQRSKLNALRHGLTAETIINVLEDPADYEAFEAEIRGDFRPRTATEHELINRLASLLWRLRRATAIESGLMQIHAGAVIKRKTADRDITSLPSEKLSVLYKLLLPTEMEASLSPKTTSDQQIDDPKFAVSQQRNGAVAARAFLSMIGRDDAAFDRLGRYETRLWRQARQAIILLYAFRRRTKNTRSCSSDRSRGLRRPVFFTPQFYERR